MTSIKSFTELNAWKDGHQLVLMIYKVTANFPKREDYALASQMNRAAVSVTSNIAEGFSRRTSKDKINFYFMALGSLAELQSQLIVARDVKYLDKDTFQIIADQTILVSKLTNGLIKAIRNSKNT